MTKRIVLFACVVALVFSSCTRENYKKVRLASMSIESVVVGGLTVNTTSDFLWEKNQLTAISESMNGNPMSFEVYVYDGKNVVEVYEQSGKWHKYFTYQKGKLESFYETDAEGNTIISGKVLAFTKKGEIQEMFYDNGYQKHHYFFTWENGDLVSAQDTRTDETGEVVTNYAYTYDNSPSVYTGMPIVQAIGDCFELATRGSKHNKTSEGYTYAYDDDNRLVSASKDNITVRYTYVDNEK